MTVNSSTTIVDRILILHRAFASAQDLLEQCFMYSVNKAEAEGLAIVGESGTGKTSLVTNFADKHRPKRGANGMEVPILFVTVPAAPTVKSLAGAMIHRLGASDPERGTENDKTWRLRVLMEQTGTRMIILDEFQHFFDRGKRQVMHHVADWLKLLMDDMRSTVVVTGLPECTNVIAGNEQLERRFLAPIELPQFDWFIAEQRDEFIDILENFGDKISDEFETPELHSEQMAYQFWCATGGLLAHLSKLLRCSLRKALQENRKIIRLADFAAARETAMWLRGWEPGVPKPFDQDFSLVPSADVAACVRTIGIATETLPTSRARNLSGQDGAIIYQRKAS
jgi:hypothetical protein